ncbi:chemotaxis protein CheB [Arsenicibacter rosenii]|uniref:protein-glutamate methylesterase n=1 Tax=Arsenicibacter rosenii TaxID=1750698 RepID=A0A1S2VQE9_9BACT|nr:chemotaxis protein CheB [Arsenicibacter rosenii]OIN60999.1 chemotaxis protein CheB [Arsenicibacter rosenii]
MEKSNVSHSCKAVIIGGSAGSIEVLLKILPALPEPLTYTLIIVLHRKHTAESALADLLTSKSRLVIHEVEDKEPLLPGNIYLAPADYHLLIEHSLVFSLDASEKVNYSRPSLDVSFESAADVFGPSLVGILLSGANADGTLGLKAIKRAGGLIIAQKPETARVAYMPQQAIQEAGVDYVLDIFELARLLNLLNNQGD